MYEINNIYNANSYWAIKELPDKCIDLIITDPPYQIAGGGGGSSPLAKRKVKQKDSLENKDLHIGINDEILIEMVRVMKKINIFLWCNKNQIHQYLNFFMQYDVNFELLVWHKTNPIPSINNTFLPDLEYCCVFREKGLGLNGNYHEKRKMYSTPINKSDKEKYLHPTIKPEEPIANFITIASNPNDVVADFFLGSGTTCKVAKDLGRQYIGFEIDEQFYNIAKNRILGIDANNQVSLFADFDKLEE